MYYILLGLAPAIFFVWYIYKKDKWQPEPLSQIRKIFFLGMASIIPAIILESVLTTYCFHTDLRTVEEVFSIRVLFLFLIVGPIEELCKYSVVKRFIFHTEHFDERIDGVVYMVVAAMGFAGFENIMYIINSPNPTLVGIIRCVTSTPGHAIFSGFFGIFLGNAYICRKNQEYGKAWGQIILGFLIALTLHAIYDLFAFSQNTAIVLGGIAGFVIFFGILLIVIVNKLAHESKLELEQSKSKE